jgi:hypothetical protein
VEERAVEDASNLCIRHCPQGDPLPPLPTEWFDGVAWRDGREACRHCYEVGAAMDRTKATV